MPGMSAVSTGTARRSDSTQCAVSDVCGSARGGQPHATETAMTRISRASSGRQAGSCLQPFAVAGLATGLAAMFLAMVTAIGTASAASLTRIETGRPSVVSFLLQGQLLTGDLQRVRAAVSKVPAGTAIAVILDSPGGNLGEGLMLGAFFHEARIATIVKGGGGKIGRAHV